MPERLIAFGGTIKTLTDGRIGGYLVVYSDPDHPDLEGDFFTPRTDFDFEDGHQVGVYYLHGLDPTLRKRRLGRATLHHDPVGIWLDAQLELRDDYERAVYQLAQSGALGWSSGAAAHLVERAPWDGQRQGSQPQHITRWTIAEASLTPTPAEPRARVVPIKSLAAAPLTPSVEQRLLISDIPEPRRHPMPHVPPQADAVTTLQAQLADMGEQLSRVLQYMEDSPSVKGAGYFTVDGGAADPHIKSFGDWLMAVMRGDEARLRRIYHSAKTLSGDSGGAGGYTVPAEYSGQLLQVATGSSQVLARVRRIPVSAPMGEYPALDQYLSPAAGTGESALAAGVKPGKRVEGAAYSETEPQFEMIRYRITDAASGMVKVTKELRADSAAGVEAFLHNVIGVAVANKMEHYILRGSGAGEPLGLLNAPALVNITPATNNVFAYADAVSMVSRFKAVGGVPVWLYHPGMINDIAKFEVGTGGAVFVNQLNANMSMTLLGNPMLASEHLPQPDSGGCVVLADLGAYVLFEKGGLYIEFSEHAAFAEGKDTWRFGVRCDGQPWMKAPITLADPQGSYTVSPYVAFND
jgi:HK97 family phage major capsid protein